jgi:hypothetical protein
MGKYCRCLLPAVADIDFDILIYYNFKQQALRHDLALVYIDLYLIERRKK